MITRGSGYVKGNNARRTIQLGAHMRYLEHRKGDDERAIFGADRDQVSRAEAMKDIEAHGDRYVAYHKIVLSPSAEEREGITDWHQWTRDVMKDFAERKEMDLTWNAVKHDNTDDPHVHIVLAGSGTRADDETATVKMYPRDFQALRDIGRDRSEVEQIRQARTESGEQDRLEARELGIALPIQAEPERPTHVAPERPTHASPEHPTRPDPDLPSSAASPTAKTPQTRFEKTLANPGTPYHMVEPKTAGPTKVPDVPDTKDVPGTPKMPSAAPDTPSTPSAAPETPSLLPLVRVVTKPIIDIDR